MRLRFAPSPTGFLHIGNARTAIINHICTKKNSATLVLRIEDTDMDRSSRESENSILRDLEWLGIEWHEGPDCGGQYGPYRQSERIDIYKQYTKILVDNDLAYPCFCTADEIDQMRKDAQNEGRNETYNGKCRHLSAEQRKTLQNEGKKSTIRFKVEPNIDITFDDIIKGSVSFNSSNIGGDFIIERSDEIPTYNYIVVIDDALMKISHVIRGEDHLSNTPKQILISRALKFTSPLYAHMPLVMGDDKKKLSKRHGITSVNLYQSEGYLPNALVNYIAMLGWASETEEEILPLDEIIRQFELKKIAGSSAVFDYKKLRWMNGNYLREIETETLYHLLHPYLIKDYDLTHFSQEMLFNTIEFLKPYCELLSDINKQIDHFLLEKIPYNKEVEELFKSESGKIVIDASLNLFNSTLTPDNYFSEYINGVKDATGLKGKNLFMPCRAIICGSLHGPDLAETMKLYGYDKCKIRIEQASKI